MSNEKPEDIVKKNCLEVLLIWSKPWTTEEPPVVIDYDDVSGLGKHMNLYTGRWFMHTKKGKRDLIAWFRVERILWTYLIECKAPEGGVWKPEQQQYALKFENFDNCIYEVVSDARQIDATLEKITGRTSKLLWPEEF